MIDLTEVQSSVLRPPGATQVEVAYLAICCRERMRAFLRVAADALTDSAEGEARRSADDHQAINVALGAEGVRLAGIDDRTHDALSSAFTRGMAHAVDRLVDVGASAPAHWEAPFTRGAPPVHAALLRFDQAPLDQLDVVLDGPGPCAHQGGGGHDGGPARLVSWHGQVRPDRTEPFGFVDGLSDPVVQGAPQPLTPGNGVWDEQGGAWRRVRPGELVLGHPDESGAVAGHPGAAQVERDGTYLVVRKLEQDVQGFHDACRDWAAELGDTAAEDVEAQLVGRRHDGTVLGLEPDGLNDPDDPTSNDFLFVDDRRPRSTMPPSSHVRRSNPRDGATAANATVNRHLLFRRSYPYQQPAPDGSPAGSREGLLFMACCADPRRQFEFVQAQWLQDGNRFGLGHERDPLVGQRPGPDDGGPAATEAARRGDGLVSIRHGGRRVRRAMSSFVTMRGGEYLLLPSRSALRLLGHPDRR